ncbi:MAG: enhanced intracellular survival protein Eis [Actinomycetota bacterium]
MEIRRPREDEMRRLLELSSLSFNVPMSRIEDGPPMRPEHMLAAFDGERLRAMARDIPVQQWFGGRPMSCAAISSVATIPEARGTGVGKEVMRALLQRARDRGAVVTSLFPATVPFYRRLGYEYGGVWTIYRAPLGALPRAPADAGVEVDEFDPDGDLSEIRGCYRSFADGGNGLVDGEDDDWWPNRVLQVWVRDAPTRSVVARGPSGVEGYAAFSLASRGEWKGYDVSCTHLVATTRGAALALLGYVRRYKGVGRGVKWQGPPNEPLALLLDEENLSVTKAYRFMTRILDVPAALEARGYPEGLSGEIVIEVDDPLFEANAGVFRVSVEGGKARVERTDAATSIRVGIDALSAMFAANVSPADLLRTGAIAGDGSGLPVLASLFAGPPPWMLDHF